MYSEEHPLAISLKNALNSIGGADVLDIMVICCKIPFSAVLVIG